MKRTEVDKKYMMSFLEAIMEIPSPVGDCDKVLSKMEEYAKEMGYAMTYDNKSTGYISIKGLDDSETHLVTTHVDTLGMMVKSITERGELTVVELGGLNFSSLEGETVDVHTRDGRSYSGLIIPKSHSVHVFEDCRSMKREANNMIIMLDEIVSTKKDVKSLGICAGDTISVRPRYEFTDSGFIKSRFIDDKAAVAAVFAMLKHLHDNDLKPKYNLILTFPQYEEIGHGGSVVPDEVSEYIAIDIGLVGPHMESNEREVSIFAKDNQGVFDKKLTTKLVNLAVESDVDFSVNVHSYRYGSDAGAALRGGNDVAIAAFGPGTLCSHGMERTHIDALNNVVDLLIAYVLEK